MVQQVVKKDGAKRWLVRYPRALPIGIFLLVAAITVLSVYAIERGEQQKLSAELEARSSAIASALERRSTSATAYLRAGAALLSTTGEVPEPDFRQFVTELRLDDDYRGVDGIGWAMLVRPQEVDAFNALMAAAHPGEHSLYPMLRGDQPFAVPVTYLHPESERSRRALGYDMYSDAIRRAAMQQAAENERPTASDQVVLQQEGGVDAPGFLIYMPVFESLGGQRALKGFIYSPFNADHFLSSALELEGLGAFSIRLYDGTNEDPGALLVNAGPSLDGAVEERIRRVNIANNQWLLVIGRETGWMLSGLSMATLIFGLLVASLLAILVRMLTEQAQEDEASLAWFAEQASIRNSLTRELNHRVKNTLANVLSIISLTRRRAADLDGFADGLTGRIRALSATHDLLTDSDWGSTPINAVIEAELLPYAQGGDHNVAITGPNVDLAPSDALSLGLALHELATNAAKYGALSQPGGHLTVTWKKVEEFLVRVEWLERGGPPVPQDRGRGFGTDLIERIVAHELHNPVELNFEVEGVHCVMHVPIREPREFALRADNPAKLAEPPRKARMALRAEAQSGQITRH